MVFHRLQTILAFSFTLLVTTSAFSAQKSSRLVRSPSSSSALFVGAVWTEDNENDAFLMNRATACADGSESCSLEEAESYLHDILTTQKDCQAIAISSALCENVDVVSEVVANLRQKITVEKCFAGARHLSMVCLQT